MFVILIVSFNPDFCFVYFVTHIEQVFFFLGADSKRKGFITSTVISPSCLDYL